jgi:membrane fusion protein YbhG
LIVAVALGSYVGLRIGRSHAPLEWSGTVEAHTIEVGSRVGGRVLEVHVREADSVVAGQPLVTLEKGDLPAQRLTVVLVWLGARSIRKVAA